MKFDKNTQIIAEQSLAYFLSKGHYLNIKIDETGRHTRKHEALVDELSCLCDVADKIFNNEFFNNVYVDYFKFLRRENGDTSKDEKELYQLALDFIETEKIWEGNT